MAAKFKSILPKLLDPGMFRDEFRQAAKDVSAGMRKSFEGATAFFKDKPEFSEFVRVTNEGIYITVSTDSLAFKYYDQGNGGPNRIIRPTKAKALHWVDKAGEDVFVKWVHGYDGRKVSEAVQKEWDALVSDYFDRAIDIGVRKSGHVLA